MAAVVVVIIMNICLIVDEKSKQRKAENLMRIYGKDWWKHSH